MNELKLNKIFFVKFFLFINTKKIEEPEEKKTDFFLFIQIKI